MGTTKAFIQRNRDQNTHKKREGELKTKIMLTSRAWIIASGLVGAISLMLRSVLNFSVTGFHFSLPTLNPLFIIINGIIFALAASSSLFGHGSDSSATEHNHDHDTYHHYEHDDHNHNHSQNHDHDRSWNNSSSDFSFDQYNNKVHEVKKFPVKSEKSESGGSSSNRRPVSSPEIQFPSKAPEKPTGPRRPPTVPLKTFPQGMYYMSLTICYTCYFTVFV